MLDENETEETPAQEIEKEEEIADNEVKPVSLRDSLREAVRASKQPAEEPSEMEKPRDESGKFTKSKKETAPKETDVKLSSHAEPVKPQVKPHSALGPTVAAIWDKLPPEAQEVLSKRGEEIHKGFTSLDDDRNLGKQLRELSTPYMATIQAEGGDLPKAFQSFLNHAYVLRTASPQQKGALIWQLAREFGADMAINPQQAQNQFNPQIQGLQQQLQHLQNQLEQEKALKKQQEDMTLQSQIDAFKADPSHQHFETLKSDMASLLRSGAAKDLQEAYDKAMWANPQTRSSLIESQKKADEDKQLAEKKAKAEAAKKAGSSVKGAPGIAATKNGVIPQKDLRSELRAAFAAHREA